MRIKKGDTVKIISGKNRDKSGKVINVIPESNKISIGGMNIYKKHVKPKNEGEKGEVVEVARPMNASNVMLICPSCSKAVRVGQRKNKNEKVRYCKKCNAVIN